MKEYMKKVITHSKYRVNEPTSDFESKANERSLIIGGEGESIANLSLIGKVMESSTTKSLLDFSVWLDTTFPHVIGIFGTRGSGKSFDLGILVEGAIIHNDLSVGNNFDGGVIVFDIQDQFWTLGYEPDKELIEDHLQISELQKWGISPTSVENIKLWLPAGATFPNQNTHEFKISPSQLTISDWLSLLELDRYSPQGQVLIELITNFPNSNPIELASRCQPNTLKQFQAATIEAIKWRLEALADIEIIGDPGIHLEDILASQTVSILLLRELSDEVRALIIGVLTRVVLDRMGKMHKAKRISRRNKTVVHEPNLPSKAWLVIDEAHTVVPNGAETPATKPVIDYVKRGRDSGLSLIFATQQPSAVDGKLMSQVDITITHKLGFENDLSAALARMPTRSSTKYQTSGTTTSSGSDLIRSLKTGEAVIADSNSPRSLLVKLRPRFTAHGGNTPK